MAPLKLIGFDIEDWGELPEYGLQPWRAKQGKAWLTSYAYAWGDEDIRVGGASRPTRDQLKRFLDFAAKQNLRIVGWNTSFDIAWLIAMGLREEVFACKWLDAMLLYKHLTAGPKWLASVPKSYGLKAAVTQFLPEYAGYNKEVTFDPQTPEEWAAHLAYNKIDAKVALLLARQFWSQMTHEAQRCALIEAACLPMVADANVEGLTIDRANAEVLSQKLLEARDAALVTLMVGGNNVTPVQLASSAQLSELLFKEWGLPPVKFGKLYPSTDKETLAALAAQDSRALWVRNYREAQGNRTKFAEGVLKSLDYHQSCGANTMTVHPEAKVYSTYTGRMTYGSKVGRGKEERPTGIALHQWKRDPDFRRTITAPEGYTLLEFDAAGQEYRWMAVESGDPTMLGLCQPGEDPHSFMGARVARMEYHALRALVEAGDKAAGEQRQLGKVSNLACQYRTSAGKLMIVGLTDYGIAQPFEVWRAIHGTYRTTYPGVPRYWKTQVYKARRDGYVETLAGRRVWLGKGEDWPSETWGLESTAINFPIQGVGADQKYLAMLVLKDYLPKVDGRFYFELHDGLFVVVPDRYAEQATHDIRYLLCNLPYAKAWGWTPPIPLPWDAKSGKSWGDLKKVS